MERNGQPVVLERRWECTHQHCPSSAITRDGRSTPMHYCRGARGLLVPLVPAGARGEHRVVEREDWVGDEMVQLDPEKGRPVMAVETTTDRGRDCTVYAPTAAIAARS